MRKPAPVNKAPSSKSVSSPAPTKRLRFAILPGNNSRLVLQCFRHRRGWYPVPLRSNPEGRDGDASGDAKPPPTDPVHFVWEMYRQNARFAPGGGGLGAPTVAPMVNHFPFNAVLTSKSGPYPLPQLNLRIATQNRDRVGTQPALGQQFRG